MITALEQIGYDFHIHAIGDRGITEALNAIETARNTNGDIGARHRITHLEIVKNSDISRFLPLNITADMQVAGEFTNPSHWDENEFLLGANRIDSLVPVKAFHDAGARITLSSDWDVSTVNPFVGMGNALTRSPQQLPTVEDAVKAYTINGAYVMRQEDITGNIEVGKLADFICVDKDIFTSPITEIKHTKVLCTYLGGEEIFRSDDFPTAISHWNTEDSLSVFPSPADKKITIELVGFMAKRLTIYNSEGKQVLTFNRDINDSFEIDISGFPNGAYIIEAELKNGKELSSKFLKN